MVLAMEKESSKSKLLDEWCPYSRFQIYRELMTSMEVAGWKLNQDLRERVLSYFPRWGSSANVEDCFAAMGDACARSGKSDMGSLNNLQVTAIRSLYRACDKEGQPKSVSVSGSDWEGQEVRNLKQSIYNPASWSGGHAECWQDLVPEVLQWLLCGT